MHRIYPQSICKPGQKKSSAIEYAGFKNWHTIVNAVCRSQVPKCHSVLTFGVPFSIFEGPKYFYLVAKWC